MRQRLISSLPFLIVVIGIGPRLAHLLANHSLWLDEAMLALNIVQRPFAGLLQPLDYNQGAPIGFLLLEKLSVDLLGPSELALRLPPFLAAVGSLPLFYLLARRCLPRREALIALALFSLSPSLSYYAAEAKQYAVDVFVAVLLLLATLRSESSRSGIGSLAGLAGLGAVAIWFSHPAVFVLSGAGVYLIVSRLAAGERDDALRFAMVAAVWLTSFSLDVRASLQGLAANRFLLEYWAGGFPPTPTSIAGLGWYARACQGLITTAFTVPFRVQEAGTFAGPFQWAALVLGCLWFVRRAPRRTFLLMSPLAFALLAAVLGKYPFAGRLLLFGLPALLLLIAAGAGTAWRMTERSAASSGVLLLAGLLLSCGVMLVRWLSQPGMEEIRPVLAQMHAKVEPGDVVYVHSRAAHAVAFYTLSSDRYRLPGATLVAGRPRSGDQVSWVSADVQGLMGHRRVWVLFAGEWSWSPHQKETMLGLLHSRGTELGEIDAPGASAYLWDLSGGSGHERSRAPG